MAILMYKAVILQDVGYEISKKHRNKLDSIKQFTTPPYISLGYKGQG